MKLLSPLILSAIAACLVLTDASFPPNRNDYPDGYFFGTQNLKCVSRNGKKGMYKRSIPPRRHTWSLSHRLVYYRNAVYEIVGDSGVVRSDPNWGLANKCPVTWESTPVSTSTCSSQEMSDFSNDYKARYGGYHILRNNCHHFANRVSALLFNDCRFWPR